MADVGKGSLGWKPEDNPRDGPQGYVEYVKKFDDHCTCAKDLVSDGIDYFRMRAMEIDDVYCYSPLRTFVYTSEYFHAQYRDGYAVYPDISQMPPSDEDVFRQETYISTRGLIKEDSWWASWKKCPVKAVRYQGRQR